VSTVSEIIYTACAACIWRFNAFLFVYADCLSKDRKVGTRDRCLRGQKGTGGDTAGMVGDGDKCLQGRLGMITNVCPRAAL